MLEIMLLEERIVLDGAVVDTVVNHVAEHPYADDAQAIDHDQAQVPGAAEQEHEAVQDTDVAPVDVNTATQENTKILVISSDIQNAQTLASSVREDVQTIVYNAETDSLEDILSSIRDSLSGQQAESIAFANHSLGNGAFSFISGTNVSAIDLAVNNSLQDFWTEIGELLTDKGRIDLLSCDLVNSKTGELVVSNIEKLSEHTVAASEDLTGDSDAGGDWILERGDIDVENLYFNSSMLNDYDGVMAAADGTMYYSAESNSLTGNDSCNDMAVDADGKYVIVGGRDSVLVARYNSDGTLDTSFGGGDGYDSLHPFTGENNGYAVGIQSDGDIIVAGHGRDAGGNDDICLARYNSSGILQSTKIVNLGGSDDIIQDLAVLNDDTILAVGRSSDQFALAKFEAGATNLDLSFGTEGTGIVRTSIYGGQSIARAVAVQSDGHILVAGTSYRVYGQCLLRYAADGKSHQVVYNSGNTGASAAFHDVAVLSDDSFVAVGEDHFNFLVVRFKADGNIDSSFGTNGRVILDFGGTDAALHVDVQEDGKIVVAGKYANGGWTEVARFWSDGSLDTGFGNSGKTLFKSNNRITFPEAGLHLRDDGKIVTVGSISRVSEVPAFCFLTNGNPSAKTSSGSTDFRPDSAAVAVDDAIMIGDAYGLIKSATVSITGNFQNGEDVLNFNTMNGISAAAYNTATGVLSLTGTASAAAYQEALRSITFNTGSVSSQTRTVSFVLTDSDNNTSSAMVRNLTLSNSAPTATNLTQNGTYDEGDASVALQDIVVSDADANERFTATLTLTDKSAGSLTTSGNATYTPGGTEGVWTITGTKAEVDAALADIAFIPADNYDKTVIITTRLRDMFGAGPSDGTITLTVGSTDNDQPTATNLNQTQNYDEDAASVNLDNIVVTDSDTGEIITATLTLANKDAGVLSISGTATYTPGATAGVWAITDTIANVNSALANVNFIPAADNDVNTSIAVNITDDGGSVPQTGTIALNVTGSNDAPTASNLTQTQNYAEGAASVNLDNIVVADLDSNETITATLTLENKEAGVLTTDSGKGETYDSSTGIWTITGFVNDVNAALANVSFTPATDNDLNTTISTQIRDAASAGPVNGIITLNVTAVNDASSAINLNQIQNYDEGAASVALDDIVVSDPDTGENITATLTLADKSAGALTANSGKGETYDPVTGEWIISGTVADVNAALADMAFNPASGNTADTSIAVSITDGEASDVTGTITLNCNPKSQSPATPIDHEQEDGVITIPQQIAGSSSLVDSPSSQRDGNDNGQEYGFDAESGPDEGRGPESGLYSDLKLSTSSESNEIVNAGWTGVNLDQVIMVLNDDMTAGSQDDSPDTMNADLTQVIRALQGAPSSLDTRIGEQPDPLRIDIGLHQAATEGSVVPEAHLRDEANQLSMEIERLRFNSQQTDFSVTSLEKAVDQLFELATETQGNRDVQTVTFLSDVTADLINICKKCASNGENVAALLAKLDSARQVLAQ